MSSPPSGVIPNTEATSPYLYASFEDLVDLWPLIDDEENLATLQPVSSNLENINHPSDGNVLLSSTRLQAANAESITCMPPQEHGSSNPLPTVNHNATGGQLLEIRDMAQALLFTDRQLVQGVPKFSEENAGCPTLPDVKGKGKAADRILSPPGSGDAEHQSSRRMRTGRRRGPNALQIEGEEGSVAKKQDHNERERVRRMKLNASYLALGELLPPSRRSKKRWSAPVVIDKVVDYIPELKREIKELSMEKEKLTLDPRTRAVDNIPISRSLEATPDSDRLDDHSTRPITVSVHEVRSSPEELIIQICMKKEKMNEGEDSVMLYSVLSNFEAKGLSILSASTLDVGEDRVCYHLHVQWNAYVSLQAFCDNMTREEILPFLDPIMNKLFIELRCGSYNELRFGSYNRQLMCMYTIRSVAAALGQAFVPYAGRALELMKPVMEIICWEFIPLRTLAVAIVGIVALTVGRAGMELILAPYIEAAISGFGLDDSWHRKHTHGFFSNVAKTLGDGFAKYLPGVVPLAISSCNLDEAATHGHPEFIDRTEVLDEKAAATQALGLFTVHTKSAFAPYLEESMSIMINHSAHYHEDVRLQGVIGLKNVLTAAQAVFQSHSDGAAKAKEVLGTVMNIYTKAMVEDGDRRVVAQVCTNTVDILKDFEYAAWEPCMNLNYLFPHL